MRTLRLQHCVACVLVACVLVAGACSESAKPPVGPPPPASESIATITVTPASAVIAMGATRALSAVAKDAGGSVVSATFSWQSSSAAVATVSAAGTLTAVAPGVASIRASSGSVQSVAVEVTVTDNTPWPTSGATSSDGLIADALAQGAITPEQALIYEVFAAFVDSRLPAIYRGAPSEGVDNRVLMDVAQRYSSLSPAAKATLAPFLLDPGYAGSWYQARFQRPAAVQAALGSVPTASPGSAPRAPASASAECLALLDFNGFKTRETTHFSIHYAYGILGAQWDLMTSMTADIVASEAEAVWTKETSTFGKEPLKDGGFANNGCDDKVDIWIYDVIAFDLANGSTELGKTIPYIDGSCTTPSRIHLQGEPDLEKIRATLAHEFFHVLELGSYARPGCTDEYFWLGEATANWAMDLVYPDDDYEQAWAGNYSFKERLTPLDEPGQAGRAKETNGYNDYPFLLYLARKYDDSVIKAIWDATQGANSVSAIVNALASRGGIRTIWPEFALALWNDHAAGVEDDLFTWDGLEWGMKMTFDLADGGRDGQKSTPVDMGSAPRKSFELMKTALDFPSGNSLPRLSIHADYLKFTDPSVASVLYLNPLAMADLPDLKIQALVKKGGAWRAAEDWTKESFKSFCLDLGDERVQELVLIYSNGDGARPSEAIPFPAAPSVNVSNVGCAKWTGTASIETVVPGPAGGTSLASVTNLVFERLRYPQLPNGAAGQESFTNTSGAVAGSATSPCTSSSAQGVAIALDASLLINLDNLSFGSLGPPPDRDILQGIGSTTLSTTTVSSCGTPTVVGDQAWSWFEIPVPGHSVSADGRTIEGNVVQTAPPGTPEFTSTLKWKLTAVREP